MASTSQLKSWAPGLVALGVLLSTCAEWPDGALDAPEQTEQLLQGTWLREYAVQDVKARRILRLRPDGAFQEAVRVVDGAGAVTRHAHEGTWLYDGTNLKRKYTLVDGEPPSRLNVPFATFEISFESRDEFLGIDHIRGHKVRYRRVGADTDP